MSKKSLALAKNNMVAKSKDKNKVLSCSTPEHDSPSRDSDSICDSETTSPVPFLCTQDGVDGETDVVWNYYTPKADGAPLSKLKNSTPLSRKAKKFKEISMNKPIQRRRPMKPIQKNTELFQELLELNQNLHKFLEKKSDKSPCIKVDSDEDIFNNSCSVSPKSGLRNNKKCLRKNLLSSKFSKPDAEHALESDDSMNECLLRASQIVEEKINNEENNDLVNDIQDSVDNILSNIVLETPKHKVKKKTGSPCINNDSFDNFVGNLNDSALERLTQMPAKITTPVGERKMEKSAGTSNWILQDVVVHDSSPSPRKIFGRHSSMPESPTVVIETSKPSTSGMIFGRHNSMPYNKNLVNPDDSPIRCTPDEIKIKHLQAREKLLAKRLLPFTSTQQSIQCTQQANQDAPAAKKPRFQPKAPVNGNSVNSTNSLKQIIEKKRQEAVMKLRRKQPR